MTRAPAVASSTAIASPMPRAPPVTSATRPSSPLIAPGRPGMTVRSRRLLTARRAVSQVRPAGSAGMARRAATGPLDGRCRSMRARAARDRVSDRVEDRSGPIQRRGRDSNPRRTKPPETVFETAAFNRSATPPDDVWRLDGPPGNVRPEMAAPGCRLASSSVAASPPGLLAPCVLASRHQDLATSGVSGRTFPGSPLAIAADEIGWPPLAWARCIGAIGVRDGRPALPR